MSANGTKPAGPGTGSTPRVGGAVAGAVLRTIHAGLSGPGRFGEPPTQDELAALLDVSVDTLKGWLSGRRPLANAPGRTMVLLRRRLRELGAAPELLAALETALDVDVFLQQAREGDFSLLSSWVATRSWNDLLSWALAGKPPPQLGTTPAATPGLGADEKADFYAGLQNAVETGGALMRRQGYFIGSWNPDGAAWLADAPRMSADTGLWTPAWVADRSLVVARACQGDVDPLRHFIKTRIGDDDANQAANLNYWAYWIGETPGTATSDAAWHGGGDLGPWPGTALLRHLAGSLAAPTPYVDLTVHSIHSLLTRRPLLLSGDPAVAAAVMDGTAVLLDGGADISEATRRALDQLHFSARLHNPPNRRTT